MEQILSNFNVEINKYVGTISKQISDNDIFTELNIDDIFNIDLLIERIDKIKKLENIYPYPYIHIATDISRCIPYDILCEMLKATQRILPEHIKIYCSFQNCITRADRYIKLLLYTDHDLIINVSQTNDHMYGASYYYQIFSKAFNRICFCKQNGQPHYSKYTEERENIILNEKQFNDELKKCVKYISPYIYLDYLLTIDEQTILQIFNKCDNQKLIDKNEYITELELKLDDTEKTIITNKQLTNIKEEESTQLIIILDKKLDVLNSDIENNKREKDKEIKEIYLEKDKEINNLKKQYKEEIQILKNKNDRLLNDINDKNLQNKKLNLKLNDLTELYDKLQEKSII